MKTALVKQVLDVFGPWAGVKWKDTSPVRLFEVWPGKAVYWELTCMLQADWYVVPQISRSDYIRAAIDNFPGRAAVLRKYTKNISQVREVPFDLYDLVITFDAFLDVPKNHQALFAYFAQEHWDRLYATSLQRPAGNYDLFLAHMMDSNTSLGSLPQSISFPYLHDTHLVRSTFQQPKREAAWVEWRTLMTLAMKNSTDPWSPEADAAARRLESVIDLPVVCRGMPHKQTYGFSDPPAWGDAAVYLKSLADCKYFLSVGVRIGAGQSLAEAAAAGCICIGQEDRAYQRLLCHPAALCTDIGEMPRKLRAIVASPDLQAEVLAHQDRQLTKHFHHTPLDTLARALEMKRKQRR